MDNQTDIFDILNEIPVLTPEGRSVPQFKNLAKKHDVAEFDQLCMYLYFVYHKKSVYFDMLPIERKQLVCKDRLKVKSGDWKKWDMQEGVCECAEFMNNIQFNVTEKLFNGISKKIEEYLKFWQDTEISEKNHNIVADSVKNASMLVKLRDDLEKQIFRKSDEDRAYGGSKSTRFEG